MMEYLASMYIDNELTLQEKIRLVDRVRHDALFYEDTRALLLQEQLLRAVPDTAMVPRRPPMAPATRDWVSRLIRPLVYTAAGFAAAVLLLFSRVADPVPRPMVNRFVLYQPDAGQVELIGSFTGWQRTPMRPIGDSGYWELQLKLPSGEHRFAYILDGSRQMADPTLPVREQDDFGGENSILNVAAQT
jgi:hypothetical protein